MRFTTLFDTNLLKRRYKIHQGGTSSTKTFSNLQYLAIRASKYKTITSIVSESMPHLRRGALRDFRIIIQDPGFKVVVEENKTTSTFIFPNGSIVEFFGVEESSKVRGGRRDILFINECNNIAYDTFRELDVRTKEQTILDFNPVARFWVHDKLIPELDLERAKNSLPEDIYVLRVSTYKDAIDAEGKSVLPPETIAGILRRESDEQWFKVYGRGEIGSLEGLIFPHIKTVTEFPQNCKWICYGLDFGYVNDPTPLIKVGLFGGELYFDEIFHQYGMTNLDIINALQKNKISSVAEIIADCAEPKSIEEIRRKGYNIRPTVKGKDSILHGIDLMHQYPINVTATSLNMIKEFRNYQWKIDKGTGQPFNEPNDTFNHCIDGCRYGVMYKLKPRNVMQFEWR